MALHEPPARGASPIERWTRPLVRFLRLEAAGGVLLLVCTAAALALANSPLAASFHHLWETPVRVGFGAIELGGPLEWWVNDGLMALFFFVVGLEIKRELVRGELRDPRKAALPAAAALGGMVVPATVYALLAGGGPARPGWGIPMATDIAFVVGFLALLGKRVPFGLKILLLSLAIVDDLGAVLVIAVFYTQGISGVALALAALGLGAVVVCNRAGVRRVPVYVVLGALVWLAVLKSGVHPTVAGVLLGFLTPSGPGLGDRALRGALSDALHHVRDGAGDHGRQEALERAARAASEGVSPLSRLEHALHPWVSFLIMPLFALANAGVAVDVSGLSNPVAVAVAAGLVLGKPVGILLFSAVAVGLGLGRLPGGVSWKVLFGGACLAGIGFTMSLFIAGLALEDDLLTAGKVGTLTGSLVSAVVGVLILLAVLGRGGRQQS